jgi:hypothetical protein
MDSSGGVPFTTPVASRTQRLLDAFTVSVRPSALIVPTPSLKQQGLHGVVKLMATGGPALVCTTLTFELSPSCVHLPSRDDGESGGPGGTGGPGGPGGLGGDGPTSGGPPVPGTGAKRISRSACDTNVAWSATPA